MAMLLILRGTAWVFLSVALIAALGWFTAWLPKDSVRGANGVWASADEPGTRRKSRRAVPPKNRFVPCFAGLELEQWKQPEGRKQAGVFILAISSQIQSSPVALPSEVRHKPSAVQ
jgi:hypothetical protein